MPLPRFMHVHILRVLLMSIAGAQPLAGQAPAAASLWQVATGALARPAALEDGPTGAFWNPAADPHGRLTGGAQVLQTSDILGLSGFVAGATYRVNRYGHLGIVLGRVDVRDLVRTTTSPSSEPGGIPVFEQFAGLAARVNGGPVSVGAIVRIHDAQFDLEGEQGATIDLGMRVTPAPGLTIGASSHFLPANLSSDFTTDYFLGAAYERRLGAAATSATGAARYGLTVHQSGTVDHHVSLGVGLYDAFFADFGIAGESSYGTRWWRPALSLALRVGRYTLGVARGEGLNDVGATYRVMLDVEIAR